MKSITFSIITKPTLIMGLEWESVAVAAVVSTIFMIFTGKPFFFIFVYLILHSIGFVITRSDPDFMKIIFRKLKFQKGYYKA